jgi:hypothetical protein
MFTQVKQFVLDSMHTIDGGVVPHILKYAFGLKKGHKGVLGNDCMKLANILIQKWSSCTPLEFQRRLRPILFIKKWKMIEGRTMTLYHSIPMFYILSQMSSSAHMFLEKVWKHLVLYFNLS